MITKTFKLTIATDTEEQMQEEEEHLSMVYGAEEVKEEICEDCISREAVNTLVDELARAISDERCFMSRGRSTASIMQDILDLPSVTPQPKKEHWIDLGDGEYKCPKCSSEFIFGLDIQTFTESFPSCPKCGAKMEAEE